MNPQTDRAAAIVEQYGCKTENLIAILQDIQAAYNYLSEANLTLVADRLGISVSKVYSVATFYENFSLEAKGRHIIKVCAGTACHVRKSGPIYDAIYEYLGLSGKRRTSDDGMFTLETVACLGACGLAPVMTVDGEVHAKMTPETALELLDRQLRDALCLRTGANACIGCYPEGAAQFAQRITLGQGARLHDALLRSVQDLEGNVSPALAVTALCAGIMTENA